MNYKATCLFLILAVSATLLKAQDYPKEYFSSPLDPPLVIVGTFGEIRTDHFHTGLDLSTDGEEDKNVYAAADGFVYKIKITAGGLGKALYIKHPNGFVTVYGHLKRFGNETEHYVIRNQYERKSYEVELVPKENEIQVKKGELIGLTGSTGDVDEPHFHFEIWDKKTEETLNPLLFGLGIYDTAPPLISNVRLFPVPGQGIVNMTDTAVTYPVMRSDTGISLIIAPEGIEAYGKIGFGIEVSDYFQNTTTRLGIYSVRLTIDSFVVDEFEMDRINSNDTRYVNAHIDYLSKMRDNLTIQRCFRLPGNAMKANADQGKNGFINFSDDQPHYIEFLVKDYFGNFTSVQFMVMSNPNLSSKANQPIPWGASLISNSKGINVHKPDLEISIASGALYDDSYFSLSESALDKSMISPVFHVGSTFVPVHTSISLGIKPSQLPDSLKSKAVLVSMNEYGENIYEGGAWKNNFLTANVRHFGDFTMAVDTIPPTIVKDYYPSDNNNFLGPFVQFNIQDNLSGIKSYETKIDGKWHLMEYNKKTGMITGDISALSLNNLHEIEVVVTDEKGNEAVWKSSFYY